MNNLHSHYDKMWKKALDTFMAKQFEIDSRINSPEDDRYGMTLLARPSSIVKSRIRQFLQEIRKIAPNQYFYPLTDIHLTILSIISCYSGFSIKDIKTSAYTEIIEQCVQDIPPIDIHFRGITASTSCIMIQGFPALDQLENLRESLREQFKKSNLQHSIDKRYTIRTAHLTVIRFQKNLISPERFVSAITQYKNKDFGSCRITELELVGNNWYQQQEKVKLLKRYNLT